MANPLERWFDQTDGRLIRKWTHYFDIYHRHFKKFRGKYIKIVEFGICDGGSAQMWREYFGPRARVYGVDIDPRCKKWATPWFEVHIGDQSDREFLSSAGAAGGQDRRGHRRWRPLSAAADRNVRRVLSASEGRWCLPDRGSAHQLLACVRRRSQRRCGTFMEYSKPLVDQLNAFHSQQPDLKVDDFTKTTRSMHSYDSILVFEKDQITRPRVKRSGVRDWDGPDTHEVRVSRASRVRSAGMAAFEVLSKRVRRVTQWVRKP